MNIKFTGTVSAAILTLLIAAPSMAGPFDFFRSKAALPTKIDIPVLKNDFLIISVRTCNRQREGYIGRWGPSAPNGYTLRETSVCPVSLPEGARLRNIVMYVKNPFRGDHRLDFIDSARSSNGVTVERVVENAYFPGSDASDGPYYTCTPSDETSYLELASKTFDCPTIPEAVKGTVFSIYNHLDFHVTDESPTEDELQIWTTPDKWEFFAPARLLKVEYAIP